MTFKCDVWGYMPLDKLPSRRGILRASQAIDLCQVGAVLARLARARAAHSGALALAPIARMRRAARHGTRGELLIRCAPYYIHTLRALSFPGGGRGTAAGR